MLVLGIETSCDETAVAVINDEGLLSHTLYSQAAAHAVHGGVVPELASRDHVTRLPRLVERALSEAKITADELDAVAYTAGPGLIGALLVGASFARGYAHALAIPSLPIHHLEGHVLAPFLEPDAPSFPFLALLVSGGHTQLIVCDAFGSYQIIGESVDDAAGEAFDKVAKMLGLGYPGGPKVEALATDGVSERFTLPRPMTDRPGLDFSFSGLKTQVRTTFEAESSRLSDGVIDNETDLRQLKADMCRAFSDAVVDTFKIKLRRALKETKLTRIVAAGGVLANRDLRQGVEAVAAEFGAATFFPRIAFCTDNAAMIAYAGHQRLSRDAVLDVNGARARWPLSELSSAS